MSPFIDEHTQLSWCVHSSIKALYCSTPSLTLSIINQFKMSMKQHNTEVKLKQHYIKLHENKSFDVSVYRDDAQKASSTLIWPDTYQPQHACMTILSSGSL